MSIRIRASKNRQGAAAVEAAIVMPFLLLITLGGINIAQYINLGQQVSNASREAARVASRHSTTQVEQVQAAVERYMADWYFASEDTGFGNALTVNVRKGDNTSIPGGDLDRVDSGDSILIEVSFDYSTVRWIPGPDYWNGNQKVITTHCRRE